MNFSVATIEWLVVLGFALVFAFAIGGEAVWLTRRGWSTLGRSTAFVMVTDLACLGLASCVSLVVLGVMLALAWDGTMAGIPEVYLWIALAFAALFPLAVLILSKRIFLSVFEIRTGTVAWQYALAASLLVSLTMLTPAVALYFSL